MNFPIIGFFSLSHLPGSTYLRNHKASGAKVSLKLQLLAVRINDTVFDLPQREKQEGTSVPHTVQDMQCHLDKLAGVDHLHYGP